MYQNFGNYYQPQPQTQLRTPVFSGLKGRPVSSLDEARATSIDFDGSIFYFPDLANKRIYTKQVNADGTATLLMYEIAELPVGAPTDSANFITRQEFEQALAQLKESLAVPVKFSPDQVASEFKF